MQLIIGVALSEHVANSLSEISGGKSKSAILCFEKGVNEKRVSHYLDFY